MRGWVTGPRGRALMRGWVTARLFQHLVEFGFRNRRYELDALDIVTRFDDRPAGFRHGGRHHDLLAVGLCGLGHPYLSLQVRCHCERSEAISPNSKLDEIASSLRSSQ